MPLYTITHTVALVKLLFFGDVINTKVAMKHMQLVCYTVMKNASLLNTVSQANTSSRVWSLSTDDVNDS